MLSKRISIIIKSDYQLLNDSARITNISDGRSSTSQDIALRLRDPSPIRVTRACSSIQHSSSPPSNLATACRTCAVDTSCYTSAIHENKSKRETAEWLTEDNFQKVHANHSSFAVVQKLEIFQNIKYIKSNLHEGHGCRILSSLVRISEVNKILHLHVIHLQNALQ